MALNKYLQFRIYLELLKIRKFERKNYNDKVKLQNKRLITTLEYAKQHSLFYNTKLKGVNLSNISVENLDEIPITTKNELRDNYEKNLTRNLHRNDIDCTSGGTTGVPFRYNLSRAQYRVERAIGFYCWETAGYKIGDRVGYLDNVGLSGKFIRIKNLLRRIYPKSMYELNDITARKYYQYFIKSKIKWLRIVPSSAYDFVCLLEKNGINHYQGKHLKGLFSTGEMLYEFQRIKIEQFFNVNVYSQYSSGDGGQAAYQTMTSDELFEINMYRSIFEIVDNKVVATLLDSNPIFPFIRYEVGDIATFNEPKIIDEKVFLKNIIGRTFQTIIMKNGRHIQGLFFVHIFDEFQEFLEKFQIIQKSLDILYFNIVLKDEYINMESIKKEIENKIKGKLQCNNIEFSEVAFKFVKEIKKHNKKFLFILREF